LHIIVGSPLPQHLPIHWIDYGVVCFFMNSFAFKFKNLIATSAWQQGIPLSNLQSQSHSKLECEP